MHILHYGNRSSLQLLSQGEAKLADISTLISPSWKVEPISEKSLDL